MLPQEFVAKWRGNSSNEKQVYQQHFLDLCALVGHPLPAALDPENKFFTFEAGAAKLGGGNGWADVWYKGHFAIEYKGPGKSLAVAYEQLLQYRESLENPPLLVTGNTQELHIHTNFTNSTKQVVTVTIDAAVFNAYGWPHDLSDEEILARLLALNMERAQNRPDVHSDHA